MGQSSERIDHHALSSIESSLQEAVKRLTEIRFTASKIGDEATATDLEEVERYLKQASRRLAYLASLWRRKPGQ